MSPSRMKIFRDVALPPTTDCSNAMGCHVGRQSKGPLPLVLALQNFVYGSCFQPSSMDPIGYVLVTGANLLAMQRSASPASTPNWMGRVSPNHTWLKT